MCVCACIHICIHTSSPRPTNQNTYMVPRRCPPLPLPPSLQGPAQASQQCSLVTGRVVVVDAFKPICETVLPFLGLKPPAPHPSPTQVKTISCLFLHRLVGARTAGFRAARRTRGYMRKAKYARSSLSCELICRTRRCRS